MGDSMKDYEDMLEKSYSLMGDGVHDTNTLLAWNLPESEEIGTSLKDLLDGLKLDL